VSDPYGNNPYGQNQPNPYGAGGGAYGAPGGGYQSEPVKTDGVSVASFVLSLLCCTGLVGLILGFVGLSRTKGGKRKGRGFAIAGILLGLVSVVATIALVVAAASGSLAGLFGTPVNDLKDGQCITADGLGSDDGGVSGIEVVDCDTDHDGQVIATKKLSSKEAADYDFGNQEDIVENCTPMLALDPKYNLIALTQEEEPSSGDLVVCVVSLKDGGKLDQKLP